MITVKRLRNVLDQLPDDAIVYTSDGPPYGKICIETSDGFDGSIHSNYPCDEVHFDGILKVTFGRFGEKLKSQKGV